MTTLKAAQTALRALVRAFDNDWLVIAGVCAACLSSKAGARIAEAHVRHRTTCRCFQRLDKKGCAQVRRARRKAQPCWRLQHLRGDAATATAVC